MALRSAMINGTTVYATATSTSAPRRKFVTKHKGRENPRRSRKVTKNSSPDEMTSARKSPARTLRPRKRSATKETKNNSRHKLIHDTSHDRCSAIRLEL